jgi:hypothetical protein
MRPLADRPLGRFARPRRRMRAGLVQLLCALAGLVLGLLLPRITTESTVASTRVKDALVAVGFGVLGLVAVIFSLLFLVVQWAFSSLSPRPTLPAAHRPHPPAITGHRHQRLRVVRLTRLYSRVHDAPSSQGTSVSSVLGVTPSYHSPVSVPSGAPPDWRTGPRALTRHAGPERRGRSECRVHPFWGDAIPAWGCSSGPGTEERSVVPADRRGHAAEPGGSGHDCDG